MGQSRRGHQVAISRGVALHDECRFQWSDFLRDNKSRQVDDPGRHARARRATVSGESVSRPGPCVYAGLLAVTGSSVSERRPSDRHPRSSASTLSPYLGGISPQKTYVVAS